MQNKLGWVLYILFTLSFSALFGSVLNGWSSILIIISSIIILASSLAGMIFAVPMFSNRRLKLNNKIGFSGWDIFGYIITSMFGIFFLLFMLL